MPAKINIIGQTFGNLTVMYEFGYDTYKKIIYTCQCACGVTVNVLGNSLRHGSTRSCGCIRSKLMKESVEKINILRRLPSGQSAQNALYRRYKRNAYDRGYVFELNTSVFEVLTKQSCFYCGKEPRQVVRIAGHYGDYIYNGIDRVDNRKGYIEDNVVSCCKTCNMAKGIMTHFEFIEWIKLVYSRMIGEIK